LRNVTGTNVAALSQLTVPLDVFHKGQLLRTKEGLVSRDSTESEDHGEDKGEQTLFHHGDDNLSGDLWAKRFDQLHSENMELWYGVLRIVPGFRTIRACHTYVFEARNSFAKPSSNGSFEQCFSTGQDIFISLVVDLTDCKKNHIATTYTLLRT
jgi:hypothetical protein